MENKSPNKPPIPSFRSTPKTKPSNFGNSDKRHTIDKKDSVLNDKLAKSATIKKVGKLHQDSEKTRRRLTSHILPTPSSISTNEKPKADYSEDENLTPKSRVKELTGFFEKQLNEHSNLICFTPDTKVIEKSKDEVTEFIIQTAMKIRDFDNELLTREIYPRDSVSRRNSLKSVMETPNFSVCEDGDEKPGGHNEKWSSLSNEIRECYSDFIRLNFSPSRAAIAAIRTITAKHVGETSHLPTNFETCQDMIKTPQDEMIPTPQLDSVQLTPEFGIPTPVSDKYSPLCIKPFAVDTATQFDVRDKTDAEVGVTPKRVSDTFCQTMCEKSVDQATDPIAVESHDVGVDAPASVKTCDVGTSVEMMSVSESTDTIDLLPCSAISDQESNNNIEEQTDLNNERDNRVETKGKRKKPEPKSNTAKKVDSPVATSETKKKTWSVGTKSKAPEKPTTTRVKRSTTKETSPPKKPAPNTKTKKVADTTKQPKSTSKTKSTRAVKATPKITTKKSTKQEDVQVTDENKPVRKRKAASQKEPKTSKTELKKPTTRSKKK